MKSLYKSLLPILEAAQSGAYIYTLDLNRQLYEILQGNEIQSLTPDKYKNIVFNLAPKNLSNNSEFKDLVDRAVDVWFDKKLDKNPAYIPFCFNSKGGIKLRLVVAKELGYSHGEVVAGVTVGDGSVKLGKHVSTEDQETATCVLWNRFVKSNIDLDSNPKELMEIINKDSGLDLDEAWSKSCALQIKAIVKYLESQKLNPNDYRAARFGDKNFSMAKLHESFLNSYINVCASNDDTNVGKKKDSYDPSDIILVNEKTDASGKLSSLAGLSDWNAMHTGYKELFVNGDVIGISLKKVAGSAHYELFNIGEGTSKVVINSIDVNFQYEGRGKKRTDKKTGVYAIITGKFDFNQTSAPEDSDDGISESKVKLTCRSFNSGKDLDMDVTGESGPSLGKVPRDVWRSVFKTDNNFSEETLDYIADKLKNGKDSVKRVIEAGIKNGPWCLPFVLVH